MKTLLSPIRIEIRRNDWSCNLKVFLFILNGTVLKQGRSSE